MFCELFYDAQKRSLKLLEKYWLSAAKGKMLGTV